MNSLELAWKIRRHGVEMTRISKGSHIASILSLADILGVLYSDILKYDVGNPKLEERDRFILSKGHAGAAVYSALAEVGFFPVDELMTHYADGSRLSGHISHKGVPGIEFSTGSLGHGLSVGVGMALAAKKDKKNHRVIVTLGDGECNEGSVWEAVLFANHFKLSNLIVIIDHNKMQSLTYCDDTIAITPMEEKWKAFGWNVIEVDGHDHNQLRTSLSINPNLLEKPTCIVAHTVKGKGISFMESDILWHYRSPQGEEYEAAVAELEEAKP
ncbi:transketolase [Ferdinandcohnia quinoae]|uniref:Transketolase n=1 Tax=Fredinandcohnia quinoae TaxID=2918902 RepID=A0AAW5DX17_9BACI|nr:transketolase [Fredinandcohnia sp. SECRCQ15]MCH1624893.1 transketolase [Fredinandcohnia sp. SECRCQ15]